MAGQNGVVESIAMIFEEQFEIQDGQLLVQCMYDNPDKIPVCIKLLHYKYTLFIEGFNT